MLCSSVFRGTLCHGPPLGDLLGRKSARKQRQMPRADPYFVFQKTLDFKK